MFDKRRDDTQKKYEKLIQTLDQNFTGSNQKIIDNLNNISQKIHNLNTKKEKLKEEQGKLTFVYHEERQKVICFNFCWLSCTLIIVSNVVCFLEILNGLQYCKHARIQKHFQNVR